jgi:hypothetical protein
MELNGELVRMILDRAPTPPVLLPNARLYHDLNIYGDDADALLREYSRTFNVALDDFKFDQYFPPEGDLFVARFIRWIRGRQNQYRDLTVGDLQAGILAGRLPSGT